MDPIVVAPQARGCCLIQESITIWTTLVANCVFLGVCASVCLFFCECLRVCACLATRPCTVCVNVFLPRHITMATALFGCSHAMWHQLTPPHEHVKLLTSSFVNLSFIIVASKGISICWPCNRERMWNCVCVLVGGRMWMWIYVLVAKLLQITIIISGCDVTLISGQLFFSRMSANPFPLGSPF